MSAGIWLFDGERGSTTRFTSEPDAVDNPVCSPDGSRVAYATCGSNDFPVVERPTSGVGKATALGHSANMLRPQSWSRDGRWLVLAATSGSFYLLPRSRVPSGAERKPIPFPESPTEGGNPAISPDGLWLLYSSTRTGNREVFVESMPEQMGGPSAAARTPVSIAGGDQPAWRADGKEIFYVAADGQMMSVSVDSDPAGLKLSVPKPLFHTRLEIARRGR